MKRSTILAVLIAVTLTGCDTLHGYRRSAPASRLPSAMEVKETIARVPGVKEVKATFVQPPKHFSLYHGIRKDPDYHQFLVTGQDAFTVLTVGREQGKEVAFYSLWMGRHPTSDELGRAAALMDAVYDGLIMKFPWLPPKTEFKEEPNLTSDGMSHR